MKTLCILSLALLTGCQSFVDETPARINDTTWTFDGSDIRHIIFRAREARSTVISSSENDLVSISATAEGGAIGYHSPDPDWRETPAQDWGMDFVGRKFGNTLIISSRKELAFIHHDYFLYNIRIMKPSGVTISLEERELIDGKLDEGADLQR